MEVTEAKVDVKVAHKFFGAKPANKRKAENQKTERAGEDTTLPYPRKKAKRDQHQCLHNEYDICENVAARNARCWHERKEQSAPNGVEVKCSSSHQANPKS